jgi:predicted amidohydrolase
MPETGAARRLRVTLTQWHATRDLASNLRKASELLSAAASDNPDLVLLPENGLMIGTNDEMRAAALSIDSPEIDQLRRTAREIRAAVILGGFKRRDRDGSVHNTALVIDPSGEIAGSYDKIHLFDATIGGQKFQASRVETAGSQPVIAIINEVKIGVTICYDVRFPELFRALALAGAEAFVVPAAFTFKTGELQHWEIMLRARAIENGAFVLASATIRGRNGAQDAFETWGHAMAVDPWGRVLADLGTDELAYKTVEFDLAMLEQVRSSLPLLRGVRPKAYATEPRVFSVEAPKAAKPNAIEQAVEQ